MEIEQGDQWNFMYARSWRSRPTGCRQIYI